MISLNVEEYRSALDCAVDLVILNKEVDPFRTLAVATWFLEGLKIKCCRFLLYLDFNSFSFLQAFLFSMDSVKQIKQYIYG